MPENTLIAFSLHDTQLRGRLVRLSSVVDDILHRHDYPPPVSGLLGEMLVVVALLSSNLKQEGIFTLEVRGPGAVRLMVADAVYGGEIRGYAELRADAQIPASDGALAPKELLGAEAYLTITIDLGGGAQRYQGIVALEGESLAEALYAYFRDSVQLAVDLKLAVGREAADGVTRWRAAGLMLERLPADSPRQGAHDAREEEEDCWHYARVMLATLTPEELLDLSLPPHDLLYRLFHEQGVVVYPDRAVRTGCRCSRSRILQVLTSMPADDRMAMVMDGTVRVHCQFCNKEESFTPEEIGV